MQTVLNLWFTKLGIKEVINLRYPPPPLLLLLLWISAFIFACIAECFTLYALFVGVCFRNSRAHYGGEIGGSDS